ncbi:MAG: homoserine dehydrogenase [Oscillospiraceae bacterium]|nr:homoserine dehydrogenase [Oscillospiraceae bacterium]
MIQVAILGFGTVGSGVAEVLTGHEELIRRRTGQPYGIKYILDVRDFPDSPFSSLLINDFSVIEEDPEIQVVVETIGGTGVAYDFTRRALSAGKNVVTSNKELVACHGYELLQLAKEHKVSYLFEASVGGGIPVIHPLSQCLTANEVTEITGILNGTTNYILTRMIGEGLSFEAALKEAQENGYAERDPSADIDGDDACRKICILAAVAFGRHVYPVQVPTDGITDVTLPDVDYADSAGKKIKLLGRCMKNQDGTVTAFVAPHLVDQSDPLASVTDVFNAIKIHGDAVGDVMFYGAGAGKLPTASAVVSDVIEAGENAGGKIQYDWEDGGDDVMTPPDELRSSWYVRSDGTAESVHTTFPDAGILARHGQPDDEVAFLTGPMTRSELENSLNGMECRSVFRVLD